MPAIGASTTAHKIEGEKEKSETKRFIFALKTLTKFTLRSMVS